ncbi:Mediator of RNA polymerase II transcription subunit 15a [Rhynchospora pubera]|uniref:Mediator of RNA polymerase II transcription subunit 15a n=1 Tax=Rhynchospora pubera TaxID=906938 RepID=A0AAV8HHB8_9POAL|nr:Mediator of RNA polymerase II transcription subunit 15a [Rhynchospora pubera]
MPLMAFGTFPSSLRASTRFHASKKVSKYPGYSAVLNPTIPMKRKNNVMDLQQQQLQRQQNRNAIDPQRQQQHPQQQQRVLQNVASSSASMDSTAQTGHHLRDIQEEIYQRIKYLKYMYFNDLKEVYQKHSVDLSQADHILPPNAIGREGEWIEGMKKFKLGLEDIMGVLQLNKHNIPISLKSTLPLYEKNIAAILQNFKKAAQQQTCRRAPDEQHLSLPPQSQPGLHSQKNQPLQMDNHLNQLWQQLSNSPTPQFNKLRMPIVIQQRMQNALQSDQLQASGMGFGSLQGCSMGPTMKGAMNPPQMAGCGQMGQPQAGSLAVGTPRLSATPLLAEFTSPKAREGTNLSTQVPETEKPIEKLAYLMRTMPHNQLSAAAKDIASVAALVDRIAGSAPGNGSRAAIGNDLLTMTKCQLQAKNLIHPDVGAGTSVGASPSTKKMKRDTRAMSLDSNNNYGFSPESDSVTENLKASIPNTSELQSAATSLSKGLKSKMRNALLEEICEINVRLIDTELTLKEEDADSIAESDETILVKCTYNAVSLSPGLRAHFTSFQLSPILPLKLLIPAGYPKCSPVILNKPLDEERDVDNFSTRARSKFDIAIKDLSQPMSLKEIAVTWDTCARKVIQEYAAQVAGRSFSSRMIKWQTINPDDPYVIV